MRITYESATMQFDIEMEGDRLKLTLYKLPDEIQSGRRVRYEAAGITFIYSHTLQITYLFNKNDPSVYILGTGSLGGAYRCNTVAEDVAEAVSGGSRLYRGLVALDKQLMEEIDGAWVSIST